MSRELHDRTTWVKTGLEKRETNRTQKLCAKFQLGICNLDDLPNMVSFVKFKFEISFPLTRFGDRPSFLGEVGQTQERGWRISAEAKNSFLSVPASQSLDFCRCLLLAGST